MNLSFKPNCFYFGIWYTGLRGRQPSAEATVLTIGWRDMDDDSLAHVKTQLDFINSGGQPKFEEEEFHIEPGATVEEQYETVARKAHLNLENFRSARVVTGTIFDEALPLICYGGELPDRVEKMNDVPWWIDDKEIEKLVEE